MAAVVTHRFKLERIPEELRDSMLARGRIDGDRLEIVAEDYAEIRKRVAKTLPTRPSPAPTPKRDWPPFLISIKLLAIEGDKGLGDIIARVVGPIGGDAFKAWHLATFGRPCECADRQDALNRRYPL